MGKWILLSFAVAQLCQVLTLLRLSARNGAALDLLQKGETTFELTPTLVERGATVILTPPVPLSAVQASRVAEFMQRETLRTGVEFVVLPGPGWTAKVSSGAPE